MLLPKSQMQVGSPLMLILHVVGNTTFNKFFVSDWVRLEIEPVQVSHDQDATLNFATVQSVVPGAHGLYYRDDGERKALL